MQLLTKDTKMIDKGLEHYKNLKLTRLEYSIMLEGWYDGKLRTQIIQIPYKVIDDTVKIEMSLEALQDIVNFINARLGN
jgi:hypothetical protein